FGLGLVPKGTFLAHFDANGVVQWNESFDLNPPGAFNTGSGSTLAVGALGDLVLTGLYGQINASVGCGPLPNGPTTFVAGFSSSGACLFSRQLGTTNFAVPAVDPNDDDIVVAGTLTGTMTVGTTTLTANGASDVFVVRLDSAGAERWAHA